MSNHPPPIEDKLTYLCYYLAIKHPHILADASLFVGGMLAENAEARERAKWAARELAKSYDHANACQA